jgi:integrase
MKRKESQVEIAFMMRQIADLLVKCNSLMGSSGVLENAEKIHGFNLLKIYNAEKTAFHYSVRYKDKDSGKWVGKKSTGTDKEDSAIAFAIENKDRLIAEYKEKKAIKDSAFNTSSFYTMLRNYFEEDSDYLKDDLVNNKRELVKKQRRAYHKVVINYLIPFFEGESVKNIQDITPSVYSKLKIYLQEKIESKRTINNYLPAIQRILEYHLRAEKIIKLPYVKGAGSLKLTKEDHKKTKSNQGSLLPTKYLKGIFNKTLFDDDFYSYMLSVIGLCCGLRNSEIGRIRVGDIKYIKSRDAFYVYVFNEKTDYYNTDELAEYRKIPLHPFIIDIIKTYLKTQRKEKWDFLFGRGKLNEETNQIEGELYFKKAKAAIVSFYKRIKIIESLQETGKAVEIDMEKLEAEMSKKNKNVIFYSFRHTFETMLGTIYPDAVLLNNYFMGHKPQDKMLANYLHINEVDNETFWDQYGKKLIDFQDQFFSKGSTLLHSRLKKFMGKENFEEYVLDAKFFSVENVNDLNASVKPLFSKKIEDIEINEDSFFESV